MYNQSMYQLIIVMKNGIIHIYLLIFVSYIVSHRVDYTDSLGRSRRCLKKDLPQMQQLDKQMDSYDRSSRSSSPDLLSEDMRRERERQKWEEEAYRQTTAMMEEEQRGEYEGAEEYQDSKKEVPIHYQSVQQRGMSIVIPWSDQSHAYLYMMCLYLCTASLCSELCVCCVQKSEMLELVTMLLIPMNKREKIK